MVTTLGARRWRIRATIIALLQAAAMLLPGLGVVGGRALASPIAPPPGTTEASPAAAFIVGAIEVNVSGSAGTSPSTETREPSHRGRAQLHRASSQPVG